MLHNGRPGAIRSVGLRRGCLSGERIRRRVFGLRRLAAIARRRCVVRIHRLSPISTPP